MFNLISIKIRLTVFFLFISCGGLMAQSEINQLDQSGNKHGLWRGFYEDSKRIRYEGTFNHGKEINIFKYFDDTKAGPVIATREFSRDNNSAYTIFYNQKGNKVSEGKVVEKRYEGEWNYYHLNSKVVMTRELYKDGILNGIREVFYPNGAIAETVLYKNGLRSGTYKTIAENGVVLEEVIYVDGELDGVAIYREPDGKIASKGIYVKGLKTGIWEFYDNGKLSRKEKYPLSKKFKKGQRK